MIENAIKEDLVYEQNEIIAVWDRLSEFYQLPLKYLNTLSDEAKKNSNYILKECGLEISTFYGMKTVDKQNINIDHRTSRFYKTFL